MRRASKTLMMRARWVEQEEQYEHATLESEHPPAPTTDKLGGGDPGAAESVVIYWDATTACGQTLESIYYDDTTQSGATTIVEQQDAWLIKLDVPPVASDAFYA